MKQKSGGHAISGAFVFLLLGMFALFSTLLVLLCAQAYRNTVDQTAAHRDARIIQSFMRNTLRAEDAAQAIGFTTVDGIDALTVSNDYDGETYIRYFYCYEGVLCDLFISENADFYPEWGQTICDITSFAAKVEDNMVTVDIVDAAGRPYTFSIAQRCAW